MKKIRKIEEDSHELLKFGNEAAQNKPKSNTDEPSYTDEIPNNNDSPNTDEHSAEISNANNAYVEGEQKHNSINADSNMEFNVRPSKNDSS